MCNPIYDQTQILAIKVAKGVGITSHKLKDNGQEQNT
jgi:hypothetical protein